MVLVGQGWGPGSRSLRGVPPPSPHLSRNPCSPRLILSQLPVSETDTPPVSQSPVRAAPLSRHHAPIHTRGPPPRGWGQMTTLRPLSPSPAQTLTVAAPCDSIPDLFTNYRPPHTPAPPTFPEPPNFIPMADSLFSSGILTSDVPSASASASTGLTHLPGHSRLQVSPP